MKESGGRYERKSGGIGKIYIREERRGEKNGGYFKRGVRIIIEGSESVYIMNER